ncbi:MAG: hypothetical protein AAF270_06030 [Pseudomonadota bacterium]
MALSKPAQALRRYTAQSNELHQRYLDSDDARAAYQRFVDTQLAYFLPQYDDLRDRPGYDAAINFVVADLTGPGIADRDRELARVVPAMTRLLPAAALSALAVAMELNARVLQINLNIERELRGKLAAAEPISERDYCLASRTVCDIGECRTLVAMTRSAGESLERIIKVPMIGSLLRSMRLPARLAGVSDLQQFLEKGFRTVTAVDDVHTFLDVMEQRMSAVFERVFLADLATLSTEPVR